jgi:hypothetical protein
MRPAADDRARKETQTMTIYEDLCRIYFEEEERRIAIDRLLRELPKKMAQAVNDYLAPPNSCVGLYPFLAGQNMNELWRQPCDVDDALLVKDDGRYAFTVGITVKREPGSVPSMIFFSFCVEKFDEKSVELQIKNMSGSIRIDDAHDASGYAKAAKEAIDRIIGELKNPGAADGRRPIGFQQFPSAASTQRSEN